MQTVEGRLREGVEQIKGRCRVDVGNVDNILGEVKRKKTVWKDC